MSWHEKTDAKRPDVSLWTFRFARKIRFPIFFWAYSFHHRAQFYRIFMVPKNTRVLNREHEVFNHYLLL